MVGSDEKLISVMQAFEIAIVRKGCKLPSRSAVAG
jgi:hypothetical protein